MLKLLAIILAKILFRLEVRGKENVPGKGGFILASNHASYLDPVILGVACPRQLNFMARDDLFNIPLFGRLIRSVGAFPLKRYSADISGMKEALRRLSQGWGLVVFPEGSRAFDGLFNKVQPGIGFLAIKSKVVLIPAFIEGTHRALRRGSRFIRPAKIKVHFGQQIKIESSRVNYQDIAQKVTQEIKRIEGGETR